MNHSEELGNQKYYFTCKDCVFVETDTNNIQDSCKLNRLEKYKSQGFTPTLKDGRYKVENLIGCSSKRTSGWELAKDSFDIQKNFILKDHEIVYDVVLYWVNEVNHIAQKYLLDDLKRKLDAISQFDVKPRKVIIALNKQTFVDVAEISKLLLEYKYSYGISVAEKDVNDGGLIDLAYQLTESPYMWVIPLDCILEDVPNKVNNLVQSFDRVLLVYDDCAYEEIFTSCVLFHQLKGCDSLDDKEPGSIKIFVEKVKLLAEDQNNLSMIYTTEDLYE